jgi:FemAB-related protein (PEP-CTERM system-associated)
MNLTIQQLTNSDSAAWDEYVHRHPEANLYHLYGWKKVIARTYGHKTYYLMALSSKSSALSTQHSTIVGIMPLVHMRHVIFGNKLVSIPFFDMGGLLADNSEIERKLVEEAIRLGKQLKVDSIELRHTRRLPLFEDERTENSKSETRSPKQIKIVQLPNIKTTNNAPRTENQKTKTSVKKKTSSTKLSNSSQLPTISCETMSHKVRMLLDLPDSSDELMKSFKSKLRSQIKRPIKEGLSAKTGGMELLDDFYAVFCVNMRDLGSPVHAKQMMQNVLTIFDKTTRLVVVYKESTPVAGSLVIGFGDTLENPWASSLREFSRLSPNMLLYWSMLAFACDNGYRYFDFGRSTPGEGTYKFKRQWGAQPQPLHWHTLILQGDLPDHAGNGEKGKFSQAIHYWQKLPVPITRLVGPMIRRHIAL